MIAGGEQQQHIWTEDRGEGVDGTQAGDCRMPGTRRRRRCVADA